MFSISAIYVTGIDISHHFRKGAPEGYFDVYINKGACGKYSYIKPKVSNDRFEAASSFKLILKEKEDKSLGASNINKGINGKYMYLVPEFDESKPKITKIYLSDGHLKSANDSISIKENTNGPNLYLSWKTEKTGMYPIFY